MTMYDGYIWGDKYREDLVFIICTKCYLKSFGLMLGDVSVQWVRDGCPNGWCHIVIGGSALIYVLSEEPCRIDPSH